RAKSGDLEVKRQATWGMSGKMQDGPSNYDTHRIAWRSREPFMHTILWNNPGDHNESCDT
ncbi:MAG TPA: hypothetical protein PLE48_14595, partial [Thiobacillus sp.]|nr:hypothetical protein [Thiobacillus sp.]